MQIAYDYNNFDPEAGGAPNFPPPGYYIMQALGAKEGVTKGGYAKIEIEFAAEGYNSTFTLSYNTGHSNPQSREIAYSDLGKLYYGATGQKPPANGFDLEQIYNKPFGCDVTITESQSGDKTYKNCNLRNIKPMAGNQQQAQGGGNTAQPQQAAPQAQTYGKPTWA